MLTLQLLNKWKLNVIAAADGLLAVLHHTARTRVAYSASR
jgi:hypothetical protein